MSKNYYLKRHIPSSALKEIRKQVTEENIYEGVLQDILDEYRIIHLGKSAVGWQFLFNHNNGMYYEKSYDSINAFIHKVIDEGGRFIDEYGKDINPDDFWDMVKENQGKLDAASAYQKELLEWEDYNSHPEKYKDSILKPYPPVGWHVYHPETFSDDYMHLRFSDFTEFS